MPGLNFIHDGRRCGRAVATIDGKSASPMNRLIVLSPDFSALKFVGCNDWIHGADARVRVSVVNNRKRFWRIAAGERPLRESFGEYLGDML
jgi:hypothetical protein